MSNKFFKLIWTLGTFIIPFAIYGLWVGLELWFYGEVQSRGVDNVIGLILICSLDLNFWYWLKKHENKTTEGK